MKLMYCGPEVPPGSAVPLPEGWPAGDHEEDDAELAKVKLEFRFDPLKWPAAGVKAAYQKVEKAPKKKAPKKGEGE